LTAHGHTALVTRTDDATRQAVRARFADASVNEMARTVRVGAPQPASGRPTILIVTAGTSDLPVAEEAAESAIAMGNTVARLNDVGVAGLHRLLAQGDALTRAGVVIVVAGLDGALPSVVGGLVACPVIAVPTSVGYGASLGGLAALFTMLNSCAAGVTVVNIDNGFGAAAAATRIVMRE
jgi:NCAIR mutase (PurE)-related protein